jgi:hypothetical protein
MPNLPFIFHRMKCEYGSFFLFTALRRHYGDICSDGDVIVHKILDTLEKDGTVDASWNTDIQENIGNTLLHWWREGRCEPDVWHAN